MRLNNESTQFFLVIARISKCLIQFSFLACDIVTKFVLIGMAVLQPLRLHNTISILLGLTGRVDDLRGYIGKTTIISADYC